MSWNGFGPEGGAVIADALATNNSLLEIDISGNRLNAEAAVKIAKAIFSNDNLRILRVKLILYLHMLLRLFFFIQDRNRYFQSLTNITTN